MPYYGDPEVLRAMNRNVLSLVGQDFLQQVAVWDGLVTPKLEADLFGVFFSLPTPDSTQKNAVSVLWCYLMTVEIQSTMHSVNTQGEPSAYGKDTQMKYESLLAKVMSGATKVLGARRHAGFLPADQAYTDRRLSMGKLGEKKPEGPTDQDELFTKGLRP